MIDKIHCEKISQFSVSSLTTDLNSFFFVLLYVCSCVWKPFDMKWTVGKKISKQIIQIRMHFKSLFILFSAVTKTKVHTVGIHPRFICKWNSHKCTGVLCSKKSHTTEKLLSIWLKAANWVKKKPTKVTKELCIPSQYN